ncbi:protein Shroom4 isoform X1 [Ornithorhynchus anatinus]|nr:protein Shroom4 isoform X1 [Ornithorhynchus anatinus]
MEPGGAGAEERMEGRLLAPQHIHVQLQGGAPWGFTLKGGLEHGEPLIVSKIEDGGKAALSGKMRTGDELVNINGTPLYGSRQEALILIKGSFRILKMIVRRRNVPVIRPHSWHLAKLSEVRAEAATTMHFPSDAFSLSWHSGCDTSDLSLQWNQLSRHCSTDKSSSIGSMESLDHQPGQAYDEGDLSPVDQSLYQNKRDSAYSSFSASSNASDYAPSLRPEEAASTDCIFQGLGPGKPQEGRYPQTGPGPRPSSCPHESNLSGPGRAGGSACGPPQPPVRRDSLRASRAQPGPGERRRASAPSDASHLKGRQASDAPLSAREPPGGPRCPCGQPPGACEGHWKERPVADRYYGLSAQPDPGHEPPVREGPRVGDGGAQWARRPGEAAEDPAGPLADRPSLGPSGHRHSAPEQLLASQLRALRLGAERGTESDVAELPTVQEGHRWTLSPLHGAPGGRGSPCRPPPGGVCDPLGAEVPAGQARDPTRGSAPAAAGEARGHPSGHQDGTQSPDGGCPDPDVAPQQPSPGHSSPPNSPPGRPARESPPSPKPAGGPRASDEGGRAGARRSGGTRCRSTQMRRKSERFATNLRNEIQRRKAQLQKSKGPAGLLGGEEPVEEAEEPEDPPGHPPDPSPPPTSGPSPPPSPPLPPPSPPHGGWPGPISQNLSRARMSRARSSECLSQEAKSHGPRAAPETPGSPGRRPIWPAAGPDLRWKAPDPEKQRAPAAAARGGRWRWSPEHKLQPHLESAPDGGPDSYEKESAGRAPEDAILLPFADRRRFFEETSRSVSTPHLPGLAALSARHSKPVALRPKPPDQGSFRPVNSDCRDLRRHSVDQAYRSSSPLPPEPSAYTECFAAKGLEQPMCYQPVTHRGEFEYLRTYPFPCNVQGAVVHDPCPYCSGELCPALLKRSLPPSHRGCRCHHLQWARCSDCCCPSQRQVLEENGMMRGGAWPGRKPFVQEFPLDEWEPVKINRKTSQSVSELARWNVGCSRGGPFRSYSENAEQEWATCYRAASSLDLSRDYDRPGGWTPESGGPCEEGGRGAPPSLPLRGRAFSESQLSLEAPGARGRERRDLLAKVDESRPDPHPGARKKGPPPPRPPPPNWEKFRGRRLVSGHIGGGPEPSRARTPEVALGRPHPESQGPMAAARQRSHSLPLEQLPTAQPPEHPPTGNGLLPDQPAPRYYYHGGFRRAPERPGPEPPTVETVRPEALVKEEPRNETSWAQTLLPQEVQYRPLQWSPEPQRLSPSSLPPEENGSSQDSAEVESCLLALGCRSSPARMTSEELMRDVVGRDRTLAGVLSPASGMVTAAEVMGDLFSPGGQHKWKGHFQQDCQLERRSEEVAQERQEFQPISPPPGGSGSPTSYSAYYNTSAGKAELLIKMKELPEVAEACAEEEEVDHELAQKKVQLIESISRKLSVLQEAQRGLQEDISANAALGEEVEAALKTVCKSNEFDKFRLFIGDLDKVVNLLLSLSGRLARVENALNSLDPESTQEKLTLMEKKRQLTEQLEDAKELKEHVDRREKAVFGTVSRYLLQGQLQDYQHFVKMKSALIIEQRELEEKIKLGEEQLKCLRESLLLNPREY